MGDQITRVPPTGFDACKMVLFLGPSAFHYGVAQQKGHRLDFELPNQPLSIHYISFSLKHTVTAQNELR